MGRGMSTSGAFLGPNTMERFLKQKRFSLPSSFRMSEIIDPRKNIGSTTFSN